MLTYFLKKIIIPFFGDFCKMYRGTAVAAKLKARIDPRNQLTTESLRFLRYSGLIIRKNEDPCPNHNRMSAKKLQNIAEKGSLSQGKSFSKVLKSNEGPLNCSPTRLRIEGKKGSGNPLALL